MKILYLANIRLPTEKAHGLQIMKTCEALAASGVDLTLLVPGLNRFRHTDVPDPFEFYDIKKNFEFKRIWVPPLLMLGNFGLSLQGLWFTIIVGIMGSRSADEIVYSRHPSTLLMPAFFGKKTVFESHEGRLTKSIRLLLSFGVRIITITRAMKTMYEKAGIQEDSMTVVPDAADLPPFAGMAKYEEESRFKLKIKDGEKVVMYTGSFGLYSWKGVDVFLDASNLMKTPVRFFAVGGTKTEIAELKRSGKYPKVDFLDKCLPSEVPALLAAADALVIPNKSGDPISEYYTSPMKLFEYMAAGKPIVASGLPSILEIVDESSAIIVKPSDPADLAAALDRLFADPELAKRISEKSKELSRQYTWPARAKLISDFLEQI